MEIIIFDFEVFKDYWLFGYKYFEEGKLASEQPYYYIENDVDALIDFYNDNKMKMIFVGQNIEGYDLYILKAILLKYNNKRVYEVSKAIIDEQKNLVSKAKVMSYDCYKQTVVWSIANKSLKTLALLFGLSGYECPIHWDRDNLTYEEMDLVIDYNIVDIDVTYLAFSYHYPLGFSSKVIFSRTFGVPLSSVKHTWGTLATKVVEFKKGVSFKPTDVFFDYPDCLDLGKFSWLLDYIPSEGEANFRKIPKFNVGGLEHKLGKGGTHGAKKNSRHADVWVADVKSYYPYMITLFNLQSRTIADNDFYPKTLAKRFELKKAGDPAEVAYKNLLVIIYGISKLKGNPFYDPACQYRIAVLGQLLLLDLNNLLEENTFNFQLVQSNTDGIMFTTEHLDEVKEYCDEWCERTGLELEYDHFDTFYQKDVNNYVGYVHDDDFKQGILTKKNTKVKGGMINKYWDDDPQYDNVNNKWLSKGLVQLTAFDELDISELTALDLQIIIEKTASKYLEFHTKDGKIKDVGKQVRIYPSNKPGNETGQLYRVYSDGRRIKIGPPNAWIYMDQVLDVEEEFYDNLDYDFYYDAIEAKGKDFGYGS